MCGEVYGLFDSSKVGRFALYTFAEPTLITGLITDVGMDEEEIAGWHAAGVGVRVTQAEADR